MKIVAFSDTHGFHRDIKIPDGDVLVFAGDMTMHGEKDIYKDFYDTIMALPHKYKILMPGNHDFKYSQFFSGLFPVEYPNPGWISHYDNHATRVDDVRDTEFPGLCTVHRYVFAKHPVTPRIGKWAYMEDRGSRIMAEMLREIYSETDILISHGPPMGYLDKLKDGRHVGCELLANELLKRPPLKAIICGHIHEGYGQDDFFGTPIYNVSICNESYEPVNPVTVIDI